MLFVCLPKSLHKHCFQFPLGPFWLPGQTEDNAYAKFWGDKQRALWYVTVFLEWSIDQNRKPYIKSLAFMLAIEASDLILCSHSEIFIASIGR